MATRRGFMTGLLASGLIPRPGWADAGDPAYLAAARLGDGSYALCGLDQSGTTIFTRPLPARGHAAAAHPARPEAVAFARRPGTFGMVIDCRNGQVLTRLEAPQGRHFYGHGIFTRDGSLLFTPENDYEVGQGRIGVWDVARGYARVGDFSSEGIGPHDIHLLPNADVLVVANGGIETHPESGRTKLNLPTMAPSLTYLDLSGQVLEAVELPHKAHKNSIRHLAVRADGLVAFGMQWQGGPDVPPLVGLHRYGNTVQLLKAPDAAHHQMKGYVGSIAFSGNGAQVAVTSPRGGVVQVFAAQDGTFQQAITAPDACGLSAHRAGFMITAGTGHVSLWHDGQFKPLQDAALQFDNHLVALTAA